MVSRDFELSPYDGPQSLMKVHLEEVQAGNTSDCLPKMLVTEMIPIRFPWKSTIGRTESTGGRSLVKARAVIFPFPMRLADIVRCVVTHGFHTSNIHHRYGSHHRTRLRSLG